MDWFMGNGATNPKRRGYCLGMRVIKDLNTRFDLREMLLWEEDTFKAHIAESFSILSGTL
jgi:hypothetical protein